MASEPPGGWINRLTLSDIGHGALDVIGLLPIVGEPADLANAAWLASEGNYLDAGLSLISMVPIVGDAIGKGGKVMKKVGGPALDLLKRMDFGKYLERFANHPTLGKYVKPIKEALDKWRKDKFGIDPPSKAPGTPGDLPVAACTPRGNGVCHKAAAAAAADKFVTHGWKGNPLESDVGQKIVKQFEAQGLSRDKAILRAQEVMESGLGLPQEVTVQAGNTLYKLSSGGASPSTPYWMTAKELDALKGLSPSQIAQKLGLPPSSIPAGGAPFNVQSIVAKEATSIFQSTIAPASQGAYNAAGGAVQSLVPGRNAFSLPSPPKPFGS